MGLKRRSSLVDLILASSIIANSIPGIALGQNTLGQESGTTIPTSPGNQLNSASIQAQNQACIPYSPTFVPCRDDWRTIRKGQSQEEGAQVFPLFGATHYFTLGCYQGSIRLRADYKCGERGGSGELRILGYLDDQSIIRSVGIYSMHFYPLSIKQTNISKKTYEIDINEVQGITSYATTDERFVPSSFLGNKVEQVVEKGLQAILKTVGVKVNISDLNDAEKLLAELVDYGRDIKRQTIIQQGNWLTGGNHVHLNDFEWYCYGLLGKIFRVNVFDVNLYSKANSGLIPRKVVLFETKITMGEESIKALILDIEIAGYTQNWLAGNRDVCNIMISVPMDVEAELQRRGLK